MENRIQEILFSNNELTPNEIRMALVHLIGRVSRDFQQRDQDNNMTQLVQQILQTTHRQSLEHRNSQRDERKSTSEELFKWLSYEGLEEEEQGFDSFELFEEPEEAPEELADLTQEDKLSPSITPLRAPHDESPKPTFTEEDANKQFGLLLRQERQQVEEVKSEEDVPHRLLDPSGSTGKRVASSILDHPQGLPELRAAEPKRCDKSGKDN